MISLWTSFEATRDYAFVQVYYTDSQEVAPVYGSSKSLWYDTRGNKGAWGSDSGGVTSCEL